MAIISSNVASLLVIHMMVNSICASIGPFFPLMNSKTSRTDIGFLISIYPVTVLVFSPISTYLLKRISKKSLILFGTFLFSLSSSLIAVLPSLSEDDFIGTAIVMRFIQGVCGSLIGSAIFAFIVNVYSSSSHILGASQQAFSAMGTIIGPFIAAILYEIGNYEAVFAVQSVLLFCIMIYPAIFLPRGKLTNISQEKKFKYSFSVMVVSMSILFSGMFVCSLSSVLAIYLQSFDYSPSQGAVFFPIVPLSSILGYFILNKMSAFVSKTWTVIIGWIINCFAMLSLGHEMIASQGIGWVIVGLVLLGIGVRLTVDASLAELKYISRSARTLLSKDDTKNALAGICIFLLTLGEAIGPVMSAILVDSINFPGFTGIFAGFGGLYAGSLFLFSHLMDKQYKSNSIEEKMIDTSRS